jgi:LuxR family transcriptional regulator of csgAB operon
MRENKSKGQPTRHVDMVLSRPEIEVLALFAVGATDEEIADKLEISLHTVKTHLFNIFKKIETSDRLQAAIWVAKNL